MKRLVPAIALATLLSLPASAHDGPPYPIVVDHRAGPYEVSIWADPDIGTGTFYITTEAALPAGTTIELQVRPEDGRSEELHSTARPKPGGPANTYVAETQFPKQEWWRGQVVLSGPAGRGEAAVRFEVTPPGLGPFDLLLYLTPFLAVAFLWIRAVLSRRKATSSAAPPDGSSAASG